MSFAAIWELVDTRRGHFEFESGYHAARWIELEPLFIHGARVRPLVQQLSSLIAPFAPDAVCGPLVGGALAAQLVAAELGCEMYFTQRARRGEEAGLYAAQYRLAPALARRIAGKRVAIVDDVISAGSSARATFDELKVHGALPVVVGTFLRMGDLAPTWFDAHAVTVQACAYSTIEMWQPPACPMCAAGVPLEQVSTA